jgi:hypothetical protein
LRVTLVVPGLLSLPADVLARETTLSRIAAVATPAAQRDLEAAVLADVGLEASSAPLAARGAGIDVQARWATRADPVSIVIDLNEMERQSLLSLLNAHFESDALTFVAPRADAWFALSEVVHSIETIAPERAVGGALRSLLPAGRDAGRWRQWLTETQMLLHEHPLSQRVHPVTSLWFSGAGSLPSATSAPRIRAHATPGRAGDLARGLATLGGTAVDPSTSVRDLLAAGGFDVALVATAPVDRSDGLAVLVREVLEPSLDALDRSSVSSLNLIADGPRGAASWVARRTSWLRRVMQRRAALTPPR